MKKLNPKVYTEAAELTSEGLWWSCNSLDIAVSRVRNKNVYRDLYIELFRPPSTDMYNQQCWYGIDSEAYVARSLALLLMAEIVKETK